ncbi:hypothetical protein [Paenibacillus gansuensis]|uniref:DUF5667 domain-containing protein n=1 Tax=Paenibacillus gansuensis TaxID=306542 RepID=A0ABW5PLF3_9BACL
MMLFLMLIPIVMLVALLAIVGNKNNQSGSYDAPVPDHVGVQPGDKLYPLVEKLEHALELSFTESINQRFRTRYPERTDQELAWTWFELKRYFLLCAVLEKVPMFSPRVDDLWHEMLMFTREYESFCMRFIGHTIHHAPHSGSAPVPMPGERAWFDWVYGVLFTPGNYSGRIWGPFYRSPMASGKLEQLRQGTVDSLEGVLFNKRSVTAEPSVRTIAEDLLRQAREQIFHADRQITEKERLAPASVHWAALPGTMLLLSMTDPDQYGANMNRLMQEERYKDQWGSGNNSYYGCTSSQDDHNRQHHDIHNQQHHNNHHDSHHGGHHDGGQSGGGGHSGSSSSSCSSGCGSS